MRAVLRIAACAAVVAALLVLPTFALAANWEVTGGPSAGARASGEGFPVNVRGPDEPAGWDKHTVLIFAGETLRVTGNNYKITDAGGQLVEKGTVDGGPTWSLEQEQEQEQAAQEQEQARLQQEERAKAARAKAAQQRVMLGAGVGAVLVMALVVAIVLVRRRTATVDEK